MLELDRFAKPLVTCPLLLHPASYAPDTVDLTQDHDARVYWLQCFTDAIDKVLRLHPHRTRNATQSKANGTCVPEWECSHCMQATSKDLCSNLCARVQCGLGLNPDLWVVHWSVVVSPLLPKYKTRPHKRRSTLLLTQNRDTLWLKI